ncbi:Ger(x)C family spore germination protein, partial [Clostridioides difficile]|nr:Ger(x)C family spore germination protein [Clostridioides difficile]
WMHNYTNRGEITFQLNTSDQEELTVSIEKIHVNVEPLVKQEAVTFEVKLRINATINGFKGKVTEQELKELIVKEVKKEI